MVAFTLPVLKKTPSAHNRIVATGLLHQQPNNIDKIRQIVRMFVHKRYINWIKSNQFVPFQTMTGRIIPVAGIVVWWLAGRNAEDAKGGNGVR
ncbi:hypothetical protein [Candidatus Magnetaquicoccus inordinatus]|uniref:hypothetical protein n=1 Tax=Candidatus Magnetaquicoccus inordinatus TaxID=2496818 RepID=UPI00102B2E75|nr:hypothetical protein [Candidatus Magnetaquicoccus inordinatus]